MSAGSIAATFEQLAARRETALVAYLTAGFPDLDASIDAMRAVAEAGADLLEVGIPFGDPVADGPTIQQASHAALRAGTTLPRVLDALARARLPVPVSLMSYLNPLLARGPDLLVELAAAGVAGLIVPDLPLEEADPWIEATRRHEIALTLLVAPTSSDDRVRRIAAGSEGFVYYVSVTGITGARPDLPPGLVEQVARVRGLCGKPVAVGFGISRAEQVRALHGVADGVVVGSRLVQAVRDGADLSALIRELKNSTRNPNANPRGNPEGGPTQERKPCSS